MREDGETRWLIPARWTEFRVVVVEAATRKDAMRKFRDCDWVESMDADETRSVVTKVGKIERMP